MQPAKNVSVYLEMLNLSFTLPKEIIIKVDGIINKFSMLTAGN